MESSPLNQAHYLRRVAERYLRTNQIDEALACHTQADQLLQQALAASSCPQARESLKLQLQIQNLESQVIRLQSSVIHQRLDHLRSNTKSLPLAETLNPMETDLTAQKNFVLSALECSQALLRSLSTSTEAETVQAAVSQLQSHQDQLESSIRQLLRMLESLQADNQQLRRQIATPRYIPPTSPTPSPLEVPVDPSSPSSTPEADPDREDLPSLPPLECPHFDFSVFDTLKLE